MGEHEFWTLAVVLTIVAALGLFGNLLRQPLIVVFIAVGIIVGPVGFGWVSPSGTLELLAQVGIALLLFLVGLRLDLHLIRATGPVALATGLGQIVFTSVVGYGLARLLGMEPLTALYVAVALTFSSTIIIVKLLSDKRELDQLHGRIAIGFLIVQDIVVVLVMIALTAFGQTSGDSVPAEILQVLWAGGGLLVGLALLSRYVLPRIIPLVARSQELLVLFGVAYAVSVASVSESLGFSPEVGAFLAGVSLASTDYRDALGARLVSLRDFMLLFFFLELGANLDFTDVGRQLTEAAVLSVFVLVGNPLIVVAIMVLMRYPARVGFLAGLTVAQISEFSLIFAALGLSLGHIDSGTVSLITVVGLITIGGSTYMILYSHQIYRWLGRWFDPLDRLGAGMRHRAEQPEAGADVIVYGFGREVVSRVAAGGYRVLAVDYDPQKVAAAKQDNVTAVFGSAEDRDFLETLPLDRARMVLSAIPSSRADLVLIQGLREHGYEGPIVLTALDPLLAEQLRDAGADHVLEPYRSGAEDLLGDLREHMGPPDPPGPQHP
ncbi:cation:proton antiporter [Nocardiopsis exhalans]|uniref:Cation:proton antiporter n=1 Tax=Nocardiopsis exhalans TaxID=163604 RepID=A0ABY5D352_9ACTN|nr:cation:proton antiporter family protein [Nocardiopsis exhalans]USY18186.1 cation:proton antiporter [Nocardiopsis exhalans]